MRLLRQKRGAGSVEGANRTNGKLHLDRELQRAHETMALLSRRCAHSSFHETFRRGCFCNHSSRRAAVHFPSENGESFRAHYLGDRSATDPRLIGG